MLLVIKKDLVAIDRIVKKIVNSCETEGDEEQSGLRPQGRGNRTSDQCEYKVFKINFAITFTSIYNYSKFHSRMTKEILLTCF